MGDDENYLLVGDANDDSINCVYIPNVGITGIDNDFMKYMDKVVDGGTAKQEPLLPQVFPFFKKSQS